MKSWTAVGIGSAALIGLVAVAVGRSPEPAAAPAPARAQGAPSAATSPPMSYEDLARESLRLDLPKPPPIDASPETLKAYYALVDKLVPGNPEVARIAMEARRVYHRGMHAQRVEERRVAREKENTERKAEREAFRARKMAEHPPKDPTQTPGPQIVPTPVLGPGTTGAEKVEPPKPGSK